jgi:ferredoxin
MYCQKIVKKMVQVSSVACPQNHRCPLLSVCPVGAITQQGYELPVINKEKCIECGKCVRFCPMGAVEMKIKKVA